MNGPGRDAFYTRHGSILPGQAAGSQVKAQRKHLASAAAFDVYFVVGKFQI